MYNTAASFGQVHTLFAMPCDLDKTATTTNTAPASSQQTATGQEATKMNNNISDNCSRFIPKQATTQQLLQGASRNNGNYRTKLATQPLSQQQVQQQQMPARMVYGQENQTPAAPSSSLSLKVQYQASQQTPNTNQILESYSKIWSDTPPSMTRMQSNNSNSSSGAAMMRTPFADKTEMHNQIHSQKLNKSHQYKLRTKRMTPDYYQDSQNYQNNDGTTKIELSSILFDDGKDNGGLIKQFSDRIYNSCQERKLNCQNDQAYVESLAQHLIYSFQLNSVQSPSHIGNNNNSSSRGSPNQFMRQQFSNSSGGDDIISNRRRYTYDDSNMTMASSSNNSVWSEFYNYNNQLSSSNNTKHVSRIHMIQQNGNSIRQPNLDGEINCNDQLEKDDFEQFSFDEAFLYDCELDNNNIKNSI